MKRRISVYLKRNRYPLLIVFTALFSGVVAGTFGAVRGSVPEIASTEGLTQNSIVTASFLENLKFLAWIALWGINVVGFPVIIYLLYSKGAMLSSSLYALLAMGNGVMTVAGILPYFMCTIAAVMIISQGSISCSLQLMKTVMFSKNRRSSLNIYTLIAEFVTATILALLGGLCEAALKVNIT